MGAHVVWQREVLVTVVQASETCMEACTAEQQYRQLVIALPIYVPVSGDPGILAEAAFQSVANWTEKTPGPLPPAVCHPVVGCRLSAAPRASQPLGPGATIPL